MAYDNRPEERSWWPAQSYFTSVLPRAVVSSLIKPVEQAQPGAPSDEPPKPQEVMRYVDADRADLMGPIDASLDYEPWLKYQRQRYRYNTTDNPVAPIALAVDVPWTANYDVRWALPYLPVLLPVLGHVAANRVRFAWQRLRGRFDKFGAYRQMFDGVLSRRGDIPPPEPFYDYFTDAAFARQRLDGPNPLVIARVPDRQWLTDNLESYSDDAFLATTGIPLTAALAAGTVYAADYALLQRALRPKADRDTRWRETYLPAPIVLFWYAPGKLADSDLVPVAIQLDRTKAKVWHQPDPTIAAQEVDVPIFTPADGDKWAFAKSLVQTADQNHQVNSTHVGRTHWLMEAFALAVPRQLPPDHPVHLLFEPHLRFTLAVNHTTIPLITDRGKVFSTIYAGTLEVTRAIMIETRETWTFRALGLEADLAARGMDTYPGQYPYREDARRLWKITHAFVSAYINHFYRDDAQVQGDRHLQAFITELIDPARGNIRGLLAGTALTTVAELIEIVAQVVFTCGPLHAAVHYPQLEYFTYVPASAGASRRPPPIDRDDVRPDSLLASLPPLHNSLVQFQTDNIGNYRYDRYGDYSRYRLGKYEEQPVQDMLADFTAALHAAQWDIERDNRPDGPRVRPYVYLLPSNIPNSINI